MKGVKVKAYAKINLILDVLRKRSDDYHEVEMVMQAISLHDLLTIRPNRGITITSSDPLIPLDKRNLAYQAAALIIHKFPEIIGVEINIEKNIPVEAGLAGGSTDAASVILGMNQLYNLKLDKKEMLKMGALLGSDVPFCITGPTAIATGRGEIIEEVTSCPMFWIVLVKPPFGVKTKEVYGNLNLNPNNHHSNLKGYLEALKNKDVSFLLSNTYNALEDSTFKLYPPVKALKERLKEMGAKNVLMSGSGPTIFTLFSSENEAQNFAHIVNQEFNFQVILCYTVTKEILNERVEVL